MGIPWIVRIPCLEWAKSGQLLLRGIGSNKYAMNACREAWPVLLRILHVGEFFYQESRAVSARLIAGVLEIANSSDALALLVFDPNGLAAAFSTAEFPPLEDQELITENRMEGVTRMTLILLRPRKDVAINYFRDRVFLLLFDLLMNFIELKNLSQIGLFNF